MQQSQAMQLQVLRILVQCVKTASLVWFNYS